MKQYIWYHPFYIADEAARRKSHIVNGQMKQAENSGYILSNDKLSLVTAEDHLTIVGHSYGPITDRRNNKLEENKYDSDDDDHDDTGFYMQRETTEEILARLQTCGLSVAPKILSLECCQAGKRGGLAEQLSSLSFFADTLIEANECGVGRDPDISRCTFVLDAYKRMISSARGQWHFYLDGELVHLADHGTYNSVLNILVTVCPQPSQAALSTVYDSHVRGFSLSRFSIFRHTNTAGQIIERLTTRAASRHHDPHSASEATLRHFEEQGYLLRESEHFQP